MSKIASKDTRLETGKKDGYNANDMSLLSDLEAVRKRPGMYIGSTDTNGLHHLVWEIVDNAVDEANEGYGNQISVTINTDNSITIEDRGRGVPYDINKETGLSGFEMVYLKLHAGGKFDEKNYKTAGGLHGVGGAVVNALSSWMEVDSYRDGYCHHIRFESAPLKKDKHGEYIDKGEKLVSPISSTPTSKRGTKVTFCPDPSIFSDTSFDYQKIASNLDDRAGLNSGVTFILEDKRTSRKDIFSYKGGLKEYFDAHLFGKNGIGESVYFSQDIPFDDPSGKKNVIKVEVVLRYFSDLKTENILSFANGVRTPDGGTHVSGLKKGLTVVFNSYANEHKLIKKDMDLDGSDIRSGLCAILSVRVPEKIIIFEGQTKTKLGTKEALQAVDEVIETKLHYYLQENPTYAKEIGDKILASYEERMAANRARESVKKLSKAEKAKLSNLSGKLIPCACKQYKSNELFIVEGDSASGSAKTCRDKDHQAILPLRGKTKNVVGEEVSDVLENKELNTLIYTIGAGYGKDFRLKDMHYDKVIIMTDADDDGCHIQNLLISFFYQYMKPLIEDGHLYVACPPLYRIAMKNEQIYCWDDEDLAKTRKSIGNKQYVLSRFKGLGEMNPSQLWETTMAPTKRRLIKVVIEDDDECYDKVNLFMNKDMADKRREWITSNVDFSYKKDYFEEIREDEKQG